MTENKQKDKKALANPKYRDWDILETLPEGWVIDKTAGSPAPRTVFITNGKSVLNGQKRALLKVSKNIVNKDFKVVNSGIDLENNTKKTDKIMFLINNFKKLINVTQ